MCVRERAREGESARACVRESARVRERARAREKQKERESLVFNNGPVCVFVYSK